MAGSRCIPLAAATVRRQLIAFSAVLLFVAISHCFLASCSSTGASHGFKPGESSILQVEYQQASRTNLKSLTAKNFGFAAVRASSWKNSRATWTRRFTSERRATSNVDDGVTASSRLEVEALTAFKAAITGDPLGVLKSWRANDSDVCGWDGIACSPQHPKAVIALNLGSRQLVGRLNSALQKLGNLPFLRRLDLSDNAFTGSIPGGALANCSNLSYFNISHNQVSGPIPFLLGEVVNLEVLDLGENNLTGEIPVSLGNCTLLKVLDLGWNLLEGEIPPMLGRLSRLEFLELTATLSDISGEAQYYDVRPLNANSFSGSIPSALGNCSSLTYLDVTHNSDLGGELPLELASLTSLQHLSLSFCSFQGALPNWLGNITSLIELHLSYNQFNGGIPDVLGQLRNLRGLTLGGNNLTGAIPVSITNCTRLTELTAENNQWLAGHIPPQLGLLKNLEILVLGGNDLTGFIPTDMANCSALTDIDFGYNPMDPQSIPSWMGSLTSLSYLFFGSMNLQGGIPKEIGKLSNLQYLYLFSNNLSGIIPSILENCTWLTELDLQDNELKGEIPSEIGLLVSLTYLSFARCYLTGYLPASIANLTQIQTLLVPSNLLSGMTGVDFGRLSELQNFQADSNRFDSQIPEALSNCSNLLQIGLARNRLTGEIPAPLGNLTQLEELRLDHNKIRGMVPVDILRCSRLGYLDLKFNNLEGSILVNIGQLSSLRTLSLAGNHFTGVVPNSLGNCSDMSILDLSYNQLIGTVPGHVFPSMSSLTSLNLSHNFFSGSWPQQLSQLTNIQIIDISANYISGSIPSSLVLCKALIRLDISINNLTGVIPPSLGLLPDLVFFNASFNDFQGPIPDSGVFNANLTYTSFMGNPGLCGIIFGPHRECLASSSCKGFQCKRVWVPTACTVVGIVFIVAAALYCVNTQNEVRRKNRCRHLVSNFGPQVRFSEEDVLRTIDGDAEGDNVIGVGAKSVVYKGILPGGEMFAIKVLPSYHGEDENVDSSQRDSELLQEVHVLAQLRHRNILKVLGVCSTSSVQAVILEYMPQGSLHRHLYPLDGGNCELTWQTRFNIAFGTAEGIMYLHHGFPEPLIHRDVKPNNILLDVNMDPKVGDFGISKFANPTGKGEATASKVCGTIGYMPPEYALGTSISTKGDVYSYGIVLLELLTRKPPTSMDNFGPSGNLRGWVMEMFQEAPAELLDPILLHESTTDYIKKEQMMLLIRLALFCTSETPQSRPSMSDVLVMLTQIKEVGLVPVTPRTIEDLANDHESTVWRAGAQDSNDTSLPSFSSTRSI